MSLRPVYVANGQENDGKNLRKTILDELKQIKCTLIRQLIELSDHGILNLQKTTEGITRAEWVNSAAVDDHRQEDKMRPDIGEFAGSYVRAVHDFQTNHPGEVTLAKGDVFKVTEVVDNNWLHGESTAKSGNFPYDFVEKIKIPIVEEGQKVFAAIENFVAGQDGDLGLQKGEVIVGQYEIDEYWWQGRSEATSVEGMFPVTHVMELELPKLLRMRSKSVHSSEPLFAQALVAAKAQLDEELSFQVGDIITVTEVVDEDWYMGECHGKKGMFLAACVQLLNEEECNKNSYEQTNHQSKVKSMASSSSVKPLPVTSNATSSKSVTNNVTTNSVCDNDVGVSETDHSKAMTTAYTSENTKSHNDSDAGVTPYARTLYAFSGEMSDELSFEANDIVTLIQHVDEQWIEGEIDGKIGVFPANYVEIVVDCPYAFEQSVNLPADSTQSEQQSTETTVVEPSQVINAVGEQSLLVDGKPEVEADSGDSEERYALVLYTFKAETDRDLSVQEGDTVTVLNKIDDNWLRVRNDCGKTGMCPVSYVDIIGAPPTDFPTKSHDKNENEVQNFSTESIKTSDNVHKSLSESSEKSRGAEHSQGHLTHTLSTDVIVDRKHNEDNVSSIESSASRTICADTQHTSKSQTGFKPGLKAKPALAPKPALKPKPALGPKPFSHSTGYKPVTFDSEIPKSSSSTALCGMDRGRDRTGSGGAKGSMTKAQSMFEISKSDGETSPSPSLSDSRDDHGGSSNSVTLESEKRISSDSNKAFEDWDMSKPLDDLLKDQFTKAKQEADTKSKKTLDQRSSSFSSTDQTDNRSSIPATHRPVSAQYSSSMQTRHKSFTPNYSRENFEFDDFLKVGNSSFYVPDMDKSRHNQMRPSLSKTHGQSMPEFERRPSLKKPAPPRPVGPRVPPMPSRTPIVPVRTVNQPGSNTPLSSTGSSRNMPRKHSRPAPPRPQPAKRTSPPKRPEDDLMSFSPPLAESNVEEAEVEEPDSDTVIELRSRIANMELEIQNFEKSKSELEQMRQTVGEGGSGEIHDNIQFYNENIKGVSDELKNLKVTLAQISPRDKDKLAKEQAAEQLKIERQRSKEEMKKKEEEERKERRTKRVKVIEELMKTEQDFITSMNLIIEIFLSPTTPKHRDVDMEHLFGNIEEVADVSQKLLTVLEAATQGKDFSEQVIGTSFVCMAEDMKNVYAPYCRNHDNVINLIEKYDQNAETKAYLDGLLDKLREKHVVFDLEALLIKPVQRVLKYPLLLNALIKATEDDHPDKQETLLAINAMTNVAQAINEYKRRKDLVYKYKKDTDATLGDKLAKLNLHSLKKKSSRIRERFSANLGFIEQTRDANFDSAETKFRQLEKTVKVFVKNVQLYMDEIQDMVSCQESIAADMEDMYGEKRDLPAVQKYQTFHNTIRMTFVPNLKLEVDELVVFPLNQVIQMFEAPGKVIEKRYDKLLDYDNMKRKAQNDRVTEKDVQASKVDYEAMNAQLVEELPRFSALTFKLFQDCVGSFVRAQREFTEKITHDMYEVLDVNILHDGGVIDTFNIQHSSIVDKLALLSFMPKTFSPRVADQKQDKKTKRLSMDAAMMKSTEAVPQIDSQRVYVTQQYPQKLFTVSKTHVALDSLDLSVCEGDVVGVVMEKDPMGNKERWFVDSGAKKGFMPRQLLVPYQGSPPRLTAASSSPLATGQTLQPMATDGGRLSPHSPQSPSRAATAGSYSTASNSAILQSLQEEVDEMDFALEEDMTPDVTTFDTGQGQTGGQAAEEDLELYYAEFAFAARNTNEVSLFEHQVVTVIAKRDQEGNNEWWYVDADGAHGYAPALYLKKMDSH